MHKAGSKLTDCLRRLVMLNSQFLETAELARQFEETRFLVIIPWTVLGATGLPSLTNDHQRCMARPPI